MRTKNKICTDERLFLGKVRNDMIVATDDLIFSPVTRRGTVKCPKCHRWLPVIVREFEEDIYELYLPPHREEKLI